MKKIRYEIKEGSDWTPVSKGSENAKGWLEWEIVEIGPAGQREVTTGITRPGNWRRQAPAVKK